MRITQRHSGVFCAAGVIAAGISCSDLLTFPVSASGKATIEGSSILNLVSIGFPDLTTFDITETEQFSNQGVNRDDIESVTLDALLLRVDSPEGQDLAFFDSVSFFMEAEGLDKILIAYQDDFPVDAREVSFIVEPHELRDYAAAESMTVTSEVSAHAPGKDTTIEVVVDFAVTATPSGACSALQEGVSQ